MKGELVVLLGGTNPVVTFPGPHVFRATVGTSTLRLDREDVKDEELQFFAAKSARQEEISKRQQDIEALNQQMQDTIQRIKDAPELADELGSMLGPLAAQVGVHAKRVRALQSRPNITFQCTEVKERLVLPEGQWSKLPWWPEPVMYVNPGANGPVVVVLEPTVETATVTKTRPVGGGTMVAVGGLDNNYQFLSSAERYDEAKDEWELVSSMSSKRSGLGVCVLGGRLYAVGGWDGSTELSSVERYDEAKDEWELVGSMGSARYFGAAAVIPSALSSSSPVSSEVLSLDEDA